MEEAGVSSVVRLVFACAMLVVLLVYVAEDTGSPSVDRLLTVCGMVAVVFKSVEECPDLCKFVYN